MSAPYVIGIDGGTESLRASLFDLNGQPLAFASSAYETQFAQSSLLYQNETAVALLFFSVRLEFRYFHRQISPKNRQT